LMRILLDFLFFRGQVILHWSSPYSLWYFQDNPITFTIIWTESRRLLGSGAL
jgi:hypothetical protein